MPSTLPSEAWLISAISQALDRAVMATEKKLDTELEKCKATLRYVHYYRRFPVADLCCSDRTLTFKDIGTKDIYQITVPAKKKVPREWTKISSTKDVIRYYTPETIKLIDELKEYRERRDQASQTFQFKVSSESRPDILIKV